MKTIPSAAVAAKVTNYLDGLIDTPVIKLERSDALTARFPVQLVLKPMKRVSVDGDVRLSKLPAQPQGKLPSHSAAMRDLANRIGPALMQKAMRAPDRPLAVEGTQSASTSQTICDSCKGLRTVRCSTCQGNGQTACGRCGGSGRREVTCTGCGGAGFHSRPTSAAPIQNSMHNNMGKYTCRACGGSGRQSESCGCGGGRVPCTDCHKGQVRCKTCKGSGNVITETKTSAVIVVDSLDQGVLTLPDETPAAAKPAGPPSPQRARGAAFGADLPSLSPEAAQAFFQQSKTQAYGKTGISSIPENVRLKHAQLVATSIDTREHASSITATADAELAVLRQDILVEGHKVRTYAPGNGGGDWVVVPPFLGPLLASADTRINDVALARSKIGKRLKPIWSSRAEKKRNGDFRGRLNRVAAQKDVPIAAADVEPVYRRLEAHWDAERRKRNMVLAGMGLVCLVLAGIAIERSGGLMKVLDDAMWAVGIGGDRFYTPTTEIMTTTADLRLRAYPGLDADVLLVIEEGASVTLQEGRDRDWMFVTHDSVSGWAHSDFLCCKRSSDDAN